MELATLIVRLASRGAQEVVRDLKDVTAAGREAEEQAKRQQAANQNLNQQADQTVRANERVIKSITPDSGQIRQMEQNISLWQQFKNWIGESMESLSRFSTTILVGFASAIGTALPYLMRFAGQAIIGFVRNLSAAAEEHKTLMTNLREQTGSVDGATRAWARLQAIADEFAQTPRALAGPFLELTRAANEGGMAAKTVDDALRAIVISAKAFGADPKRMLEDFTDALSKHQVTAKLIEDFYKMSPAFVEDWARRMGASFENPRQAADILKQMADNGLLTGKSLEEVLTRWNKTFGADALARVTATERAWANLDKAINAFATSLGEQGAAGAVESFATASDAAWAKIIDQMTNATLIAKNFNSDATTVYEVLTSLAREQSGITDNKEVQTWGDELKAKFDELMAKARTWRDDFDKNLNDAATGGNWKPLHDQLSQLRDDISKSIAPGQNFKQGWADLKASIGEASAAVKEYVDKQGADLVTVAMTNLQSWWMDQTSQIGEASATLDAYLDKLGLNMISDAMTNAKTWWDGQIAQIQSAIDKIKEYFSEQAKPRPQQERPPGKEGWMFQKGAFQGDARYQQAVLGAAYGGWEQATLQGWMGVSASQPAINIRPELSPRQREAYPGFGVPGPGETKEGLAYLGMEKGAPERYAEMQAKQKAADAEALARQKSLEEAAKQYQERLKLLEASQQRALEKEKELNAAFAQGPVVYENTNRHLEALDRTYGQFADKLVTGTEAEKASAQAAWDHAAAMEEDRLKLEDRRKELQTTQDVLDKVTQQQDNYNRLMAAYQAGGVENYQKEKQRIADLAPVQETINRLKAEGNTLDAQAIENAIAQSRALSDQGQQLDKTVQKAKEAADKMQQPWKDFSQDITKTFGGFFSRLITDGTNAFRTLADQAMNVFHKLLSDLIGNFIEPLTKKMSAGIEYALTGGGDLAKKQVQTAYGQMPLDQYYALGLGAGAAPTWSQQGYTSQAQYMAAGRGATGMGGTAVVGTTGGAALAQQPAGMAGFGALGMGLIGGGVGTGFGRTLAQVMDMNQQNAMIGGSLAALLGGGLGFAVGGPLGAGIGSLLGGLGGSLLGGMFGGGAEKPPHQRATGIIGGLGGLTTGTLTLDNQEGVGAIVDQTTRAASDLINAVLISAGGQMVGQLDSFIGQYGRTPRWYAGVGRTLVQGPGGPGKDFAEGTTQSEVIAWFVKTFFQQGMQGGQIQGMTPTMQQVLRGTKATTQEQLQADVTFAETYDKLVRMGKPMSEFSDQIKTLHDQFMAARLQARELGLSVSALDEAYTRARAQMTEEFNRDIVRGIASIEDPFKAAMMDLDAVQAERVRNARVLGADLTMVEKLNAEERQKTVEQFAQQSTATLKDWADSLMQGQQSPLAPLEQFRGAQASFQALAGQAASGNVTALGNIPEMGNTLLALARAIYGATPAYNAVFEQIQTTARGLGITTGGAAGLSADEGPLTKKAWTDALEPINENFTALLDATQQQTATVTTAITNLQTTVADSSTDFLREMRLLRDQVAAQQGFAAA